MDPYELKLLSVFESCDERQQGYLDRHGLEQLCEKLELEERGEKLVDYLLDNSDGKHVTFVQFRDGLIMILGKGIQDASTGRDSPVREVSPKFVYGKKKYGRRSRPKSAEQDHTDDVYLFTGKCSNTKEEINEKRFSSTTASTDNLLCEMMPVSIAAMATMLASPLSASDTLTAVTSSVTVTSCTTVASTSHSSIAQTTTVSMRPISTISNNTVFSDSAFTGSTMKYSNTSNFIGTVTTTSLTTDVPSVVSIASTVSTTCTTTATTTSISSMIITTTNSQSNNFSNNTASLIPTNPAVPNSLQLLSSITSPSAISSHCNLSNNTIEVRNIENSEEEYNNGIKPSLIRVLTDNLTSEKTEVPNVSCISEKDVLALFESIVSTESDEAAQYICNCWGLGRNGFIDYKEFEELCRFGGIDTSREDMDQLFQKLDFDNDGQISCKEFVLLLKTMSHREDHSKKYCAKPTSNCHTIPTSTQELGTIFSVGPSTPLTVNMDLITEAWETAGIDNPTQLLDELGISNFQEMCISEIRDIIKEELQISEEKYHDQEFTDFTFMCQNNRTLLLATIVLYQIEVRFLSSNLEHIIAERDKLRADLIEANERASLLAQEVDEHHTRLEMSSQQQLRILEQKHAEKIKDITEQLISEREQCAIQSQNLESQLRILQEEENQVCIEYGNLKSENAILEKENQSLSEQLSQSKQIEEELRQQISALVSFQQKMTELEGIEESKHMMPLIAKVNELQMENTNLRDRMDELTMELEDMSSQLKMHKLKKVAGVHCEENMEITSIPSEIIHNRIENSLTVCEEESYESLDFEQTINHSDMVTLVEEEHKECLQNTFEEVENLETLSMNKSTEVWDSGSVPPSDHDGLQSSGNRSLKLQMHKELKNIFLLVRKHVIDELQESDEFGPSHNICPCKLTGLTEYKNEKNDTKEKIEEKLKNAMQNTTNITAIHERSNEVNSSHCINPCGHEEKINKLQTTVLTLEKEIQESEKRCIELEDDMNSLYQEYIKCDDYWNQKLEDERELYEQEKQSSDEKYSEVLAKIRELEESYISMERNTKPDLPKRLATIEESASLENQVTDLEEECKELRVHVQERKEHYLAELNELRERLHFFEEKSKRKQVDVGVQVSDQECSSVRNIIANDFEFIDKDGAKYEAGRQVNKGSDNLLSLQVQNKTPCCICLQTLLSEQQVFNRTLQEGKHISDEHIKHYQSLLDTAHSVMQEQLQIIQTQRKKLVCMDMVVMDCHKENKRLTALVKEHKHTIQEVNSDSSSA